MNFENLTTKINSALETKNIFVDDIRYIQRGKYFFLEITLDRVGGVDLDSIVDATNIINPIVDKEFVTNDSYILDISSKERGN